METALDPTKIFPEDALQFIVDTGDCWEWLGDTKKMAFGHEEPRYGSKSVHAFAAKFSGLTLATGTYFLTTGENDRCVHPEHLTNPHSAVGRMLFIKERTRREGDCLIWTGSTRKGVPMFPWNKPGRSTHSNFSVHRFVYTEEHGMRPPHNTALMMTCGNDMCVNHEHIRYNVRAHTERCEYGHEIPERYRNFCPTCKYNRGRTMSECPRGHSIDAEDAAEVAQTGCWECRREDANEWIRARNRETLQKGHV